MNRKILMVLLAAMTFSSRALPHGGHDDRFKVSAGPTKVVIEFQLTQELLLRFDTNQDGQFTPTDYLQSAPALEHWLDQHIVLTDENGTPVKPTFSDLPVANFDALRASDVIDIVRVTRRYPRTGTTTLQLAASLFAGRTDPKPYTFWTPTDQRSGWLRGDEGTAFSTDTFTLAVTGGSGGKLSAGYQTLVKLEPTGNNP